MPNAAESGGEQALVEAAIRGDRGALERLLTGLYPTVRRWALVRTGDGDQADDISQEVMMRVARALPRYDGRAALTTWVYRITERATIERHRREHRHRRATDLTGTEPAPVEDADAAMDVDRATALARMFWAELPERQRLVFDLADLQGRSTGDIAAVLEIAEATVRAHLMRARRTIRQRMLAQHPHVKEALSS